MKRQLNLCLMVFSLLLLSSCVAPTVEPLSTAPPVETLATPPGETPMVAPSPTPQPTEDPRQRVETMARELMATDPAEASQDDVRGAVELAGEAQKLGLDELAEEVLAWAEEAITSLGQEVLGEAPCEATEKDIQQALELAGEAQKLGLDELADQLISWAKSAFEAVAAKKAGEASEADRFELAAEAQRLGLDQLAEDLMAGKPIKSPCEAMWDVTVTYHYEDVVAPLAGGFDSYTIQAEFRNVRAEWSPMPGKPESEQFSLEGEGKALLLQGTFRYNEFGEWYSGNAVQNTVDAELSAESSATDYFEVALSVSSDDFTINYGDPLAPGDRGMSCSTEIPLESFKNATPFAVDEPLDYGLAKGICRYEFVPIQ